MAPRCLTLLVSALLLIPASAQADFTETPIYDFTGEPSCVAPTGAPGEVAIGSTSGVRFLQATRTGFAPAGEVKAGEGFICGSVVARPSGAGVIAGAQFYGDSVAAVVRDPGGTWSAPIPVASRDGWQLVEADEAGAVGSIASPFPGAEAGLPVIALGGGMFLASFGGAQVFRGEAEFLCRL